MTATLLLRARLVIPNILCKTDIASTRSGFVNDSEYICVCVCVQWQFTVSLLRNPNQVHVSIEPGWM